MTEMNFEFFSLARSRLLRYDGKKVHEMKFRISLQFITKGGNLWRINY